MAKKDSNDILAPRANPNLFGHAAVEQRFLEDFAHTRLHHAYLITGPKGIGKATFAYRVARFLLSHDALQAKEAPSLSLFGEPEPAAVSKPEGMVIDPDSALFRRIAAASHTDLLSLSPKFDAKKGAEKAEILAEEAREVPQFLSLTPAEGAWRVVIVDAVDQLNEKAANALLKILEEPPENAILLLVCHEPGGILPTIRSRCRILPMMPPVKAAFDETLQTVAPDIELHDYAALYALSYGSPGLAITLNWHGALEKYASLLAAMQPHAAQADIQKFATAMATSKSPESWAMLLHAWETAMHRLSLYPNYDTSQAIVPREDALLGAIAAAVPFAVRQRWMASTRELIAMTDTFNLDKRASIRLMLDPARVIAQFPVAA